MSNASIRRFVLCNRALQVTPSHPAILAAKALALYQMTDVFAAIPVFEASLKYAPDAAVVWVNYGNTLHMASRYDDAMPPFGAP